MKYLLFFLFQVALLFSPFFLSSQSLFDIVNSPLDTVPCNNPCVMVYASHPDIRQTTSYSVTSIPFSVQPLPVYNTLVLQDDTFSNAVPIGFSFNFYGYYYDSIFIGSNGCITFNSYYADKACSYETQTALPHSNSKFPDNAIFMTFADMDVSKGGSIRYGISGQAPFRKFIIQYDSIPFFDNLCNTALCTFQCVLNEFTNEIQIYIQNKPVCTNDPTNHLNYSTVGIQSIGPSAFLSPPSRNASMWSANPEAWSFKPNGPPAYEVKWYNDSLQLILTGSDSLYYCSVNYPRNISASIHYNYLNLQLSDVITLIKQFPVINNLVITPSACAPSGTITINASTFYPPLQYNINTPFYTSSNYFSGLPADYYFVGVKDANGCKSTVVAFVPSSSTLNLSVVSYQHPVCPLPNGFICISVSGGTPPYSFNYPSLDTSLCMYGLSAGTYFIVVTDANGCSIVTTVKLFFLNGPTSSGIVTDAICHQNGSIDVTITGGYPPYTYQWSNGSITEDLNGITQSSSYVLTVVDSAGCFVKDTFLVVDTLFTLAEIVLVDSTTCGLANGVLTAIGSNAIGPYSYLWSTGDTSATISSLAGGITYTCTVTDAANCASTVSFYLPPSLALQLQVYSTNVHCNNPLSGMAFSLVQNAVGPVTYLWSTGGTLSQIQNVDTGTYTLTVNDSLGCTQTQSIVVSEDGNPTIVIDSLSSPRCYGDSNGVISFLAIGGSPPYKYAINDTVFQLNSHFDNLSAGMYTLIVRDHNGCETESVIEITQPNPFQLDSLTALSKSCFTDSLAGFYVWVSGGTSPYTYRYIGVPWQDSLSFMNLHDGDYLIEVKDSHDCFINELYSFQAPNPLLPEIQIDKKDVPCYQVHAGEIEVNLQGGSPPYSFFWEPAQTMGLTLTDLYPGEYHFFVSDMQGCKSDTLITIDPLVCCDIKLPTAFSPNGDGLNDFFKPLKSQDIGKDIKMLIYNRWGQQVFQSFSMDSGWDGTIKGVATENDTYFYLVYFDCLITKRRLMKAGDFMLVR